jgi:hypothetical protein
LTNAHILEVRCSESSKLIFAARETNAEKMGQTCSSKEEAQQNMDLDKFAREDAAGKQFVLLFGKCVNWSDNLFGELVIFALEI